MAEASDINVIRYPPNNNIVHQPVEVKTREFYAFSYYFDLAVSVGLIHENTGGFLTVNDFQNAAERGSRQETLDPGFVLLGTRQQDVPVILRELVLPDGTTVLS
ncbi:unnamed protein product [Schistosoma mattheei]|uniref:Uncharacterized protein n=1 Tax=Schistosoma mattheei TaxID=31246 RepID=A0A183PQA8_9TREM|nr:unnamed protein product [Schistosoma mattheei]